MAKYEKLNRANVAVSNADDAARKYEITAEAQVANGVVENLNNGQVLKGEQYVATFNRWSATNFNVTFNGLEQAEQCEVLAEINAFVEAVDALVATSPVSL